MELLLSDIIRLEPFHQAQIIAGRVFFKNAAANRF